MTQPPDDRPEPHGPVPPSYGPTPPDPTEVWQSAQQPPYQPSLQPPPAPPQWGYPPPYPAYGGHPGVPGYPFTRAHPGAGVAMGLGITSLVCAVLTFACCLTAVGTLAGPVAIGLALRARKEMAAQPGVFHNEGAATTGLVTGVIGTVLGLVAVGLVVFFVGAMFAYDDF